MEEKPPSYENIEEKTNKKLTIKDIRQKYLKEEKDKFNKEYINFKNYFNKTYIVKELIIEFIKNFPHRDRININIDSYLRNNIKFIDMYNEDKTNKFKLQYMCKKYCSNLYIILEDDIEL